MLFSIEQATLIGTCLLFWVPYVVVMIFVAREKRSIAISTRQRLLQELAFNAVAFADEEYKRIEKIYMRPPIVGNKQAIAVSHMKRVDCSISEDEATSAIRSILAKVKGAGATGSKHIGK